MGIYKEWCDYGCNGLKRLKRLFAVLIQKINEKQKKRRKKRKEKLTTMWSINMFRKSYRDYIFGYRQWGNHPHQRYWIWDKQGRCQRSKWNIDKTYGLTTGFYPLGRT